MQTNKFGEIVMNEQDLCDLLMQGQDLLHMQNVKVTQDINLPQLIHRLEDPAAVLTWPLDVVAVAALDVQNRPQNPQEVGVC